MTLKLKKEMKIASENETVYAKYKIKEYEKERNGR